MPKLIKSTKKKISDNKKKTKKIKIRNKNYGIKNKNDIVVEKGGPLIFTAPHTIFVKRLQGVHNPEKLIKKLVRGFRSSIGESKTSIVFWNINADINDIKYNDPNYIPKKKLEQNYFYLKLKILLEKLKKRKSLNKLLLIDFHGMKNTHGYDFIFGLNAIKKNLGNEKYRKTLSCLIDNFENFKQEYNLKIGYNIIFTGYGKKSIYTISQIGTFENIPSLQIEMSRKFREKLSVKKNKKMNEKFVNCIKNFHLCMSKL